MDWLLGAAGAGADTPKGDGCVGPLWPNCEGCIGALWPNGEGWAGALWPNGEGDEPNGEGPPPLGNIVGVPAILALCPKAPFDEFVADGPPKGDEDPAGVGALDAVAPSNGLGTLYLFASLSNKTASRP